MVDVAVSRVLPAPRSRVAAVAGDPSQAVRWYSNIRSVRWHGEPEVRVGARVDFVARFLGRDLAYTYEIVDLVPQERMVMRTASGPFPMETTYTWWDEPPGPDGARTGMELRNTGRPSGFASLAAGILPAAMRRAMTKDLERLERVVAGEQGH
ncbi:SRPBCC family protein [Ornithinimicrobium pekingense]|uniref:ATPase n=1 Tax=Ornithinimicrobium pekingense TaxID=384677 RepID=A0ABQ2F3E2_9MICO|nr:SRPBCC family protein [Ornithinimicrobium pekingense]GGK57426.1 ATPase [Ornithinimicrobium pekingense]